MRKFKTEKGKDLFWLMTRPGVFLFPAQCLYNEMGNE